ncbi:MAG: isoamylase early set domain-containing protein, partial [Spirochaetales bacterium]|nr:isoamylase early set domain-containing protein [Spirochaetales bacterium]
LGKALVTARLRPLGRVLVPAAAALVAVVITLGVLRGTGPREAAEVRVLLVLEAPQATQVSAVGDWNGWDPQAHPLSDPDGDGVWTVEIRVQRGAELRYQFLIDNQRWVPDPRSPFQVDDGFGGTASVLQT